MNQLESALLKELTGGAEPKLLIRTHTRIDCGLWWRNTPVWLCITQAEIIIFAVARRHYIERISIGKCTKSYYEPSNGKLVIVSELSLRIGQLALSLREALKVLEFFTTSNKKTTP